MKVVLSDCLRRCTPDTPLDDLGMSSGVRLRGGWAVRTKIYQWPP